MKMNEINEIHKKIREKYGPSELEPEILMEIVHILFEYLD